MHLSGGNCHDAPQGRISIENIGDSYSGIPYLMDRTYEGDKTRELCQFFGHKPVVPPKKNRINPWEYDHELYKRRNIIERLFRWLKAFRRVCTRYDKLDVIFLSFVQIACIFTWLKQRQQALDVNKNTLYVTWDGKDEDCLDNYVSAESYPFEIIGDTDESEPYDCVKTIVIGDGIKKIGILEKCKNLETLVIPDSVKKIIYDSGFLGGDSYETTLTIVGSAGSYAEKYAKKYGIKFVDLKEYNSGDVTLNNVDLNSTESVTETPTSSETAEETKAESLKLGDINLDGDVIIADAILLNKYLVGSVTLSEASQKNADCDKDGKLTSSDTLVILDYVVGSIDEIK